MIYKYGFVSKNMKKQICFIYVLLLIISFISLISSAPLANPECYVKGVIQSVEFKEAYNESCVANPPCPTDYESIVPDRYYLELKITEAYLYDNPEEIIECQELYPINSVSTIRVNKDSLKLGDVFQNGMTVKGKVIYYVKEPSFYEYKLEGYDSSCIVDSDCKVKFSACGCANVCVLKSQDSNIDCARACTIEESNTTITSCKCENNVCVGTQNESTLDCKKYYWFDNDNKECGQKEFCGLYMYYGLQTFESKTQCAKALNTTIECVTDDDCPQPNCAAEANCLGVISKCIDGKCVFENICSEGTISENGKCYKNLSNGRNAEIKIMPETASQKAIERLGELGFSIVLKEVGNDKVVYELTGNKEGKFLGIFKIMAKVQAQVDAETGDVKVIKPWWAFLASGI